MDSVSSVSSVGEVRNLIRIGYIASNFVIKKKCKKFQTNKKVNRSNAKNFCLYKFSDKFSFSFSDEEFDRLSGRVQDEYRWPADDF